jgi:hypothetical protein
MAVAAEGRLRSARRQLFMLHAAVFSGHVLAVKVLVLE